MKRGGNLHLTRPDWWPPKEQPGVTPGGLIVASVMYLSPRQGVLPCLRTPPSLGGTLGGSTDFLVYPVPKACMHVLGTGVPRCFGVARAAWNPKAAQALGCSLTPGVWILFGRVTCMARAASVLILWTLDFLLLCGACVCVGVSPFPQPCLCACSVCTPPLLAGVSRVGVSAWAQVAAASRHSCLGCWGMCLLVCVFRLYPATPGWVVRCGRVCLGSRVGRASPLLAGSMATLSMGWSGIGVHRASPFAF